MVYISLIGLIVWLGVFLVWKKDKRVQVLVLGDLGRSPRMLNHAQSLVQSGFIVDLIGYPGAPLPLVISNNPKIRQRPLTPAPKIPVGCSRWTYLVYAIKRIFGQSFQLFWLMMRLPSPTFILCQVISLNALKIKESARDSNIVLRTDHELASILKNYY